MEYIYSIKVEKTSLSAKALMAAKKLTGLSLTEIKARASAGTPLLECDCADEEGMESLLALYGALETEGAIASFVDCGRAAPIQYLRNALDSYRGIDEQEHD